MLAGVFAGAAQAASTLNVGVGVGSGTTSGNVYLPGDMTVLVGDSVKFTIESQEEHSITFGSGPAGVVPADWPVSGFPGAGRTAAGGPGHQYLLRGNRSPQYVAPVQGVQRHHRLHIGRYRSRSFA